MAKLVAFDEVASHKSRDDCWLLIHGKVYDVSKFMQEHPGGDDILIAATGKDATTDFEDVGHSDEARALMLDYCLGDIDKSTVPVTKTHNPPPKPNPKVSSDTDFGIKILQFFIPLLILALAYGMRLYTKKED